MNPLDILAKKVVELYKENQDIKERLAVIEERVQNILPAINYEPKLAAIEADAIRARVDAQVAKKQLEYVVFEKMQALVKRQKDEMIALIENRFEKQYHQMQAQLQEHDAQEQKQEQEHDVQDHDAQDHVHEQKQDHDAQDHVHEQKQEHDAQETRDCILCIVD